MRVNNAMKWCLAAVVVGLLGTARAALAGSLPNSGGPGALGTSVPLDSRPAREYWNYYLRNDTPDALHIRDQVQKLHASHQAMVQLGSAGATSQSPEVRALAARLADEQGRIDWSLVWVANDSLLALSGTSYDGAVQEHAAAIGEVQAAPGPERDARLVSASVKLLEAQNQLVDELRPETQKALRQQLGAVLDREHKLLPRQLTEARALSSKVAAQGPAPVPGKQG
jgi:hypothetical protein